MDLTFRWSVVSGRGRLDSRLGAEVALTPLDTGLIIVHLTAGDLLVRRMIEVVPEVSEVLSSIGSQSIHRINGIIFNMRLAPVPRLLLHMNFGMKFMFGLLEMGISLPAKKNEPVTIENGEIA